MCFGSDLLTCSLIVIHRMIADIVVYFFEYDVSCVIGLDAVLNAAYGCCNTVVNGVSLSVCAGVRFAWGNCNGIDIDFKCPVGIDGDTGGIVVRIISYPENLGVIIAECSGTAAYAFFKINVIRVCPVNFDDDCTFIVDITAIDAIDFHCGIQIDRKGAVAGSCHEICVESVVNLQGHTVAIELTAIVSVVG